MPMPDPDGTWDPHHKCIVQVPTPEEIRRARDSIKHGWTKAAEETHRNFDVTDGCHPRPGRRDQPYTIPSVAGPKQIRDSLHRSSIARTDEQT